MRAGDSVSIPCLYDAQYKNHVKYLCKGYYWNHCSYAIKTNSQHGSGKYLISDSKHQRIFNVTIKQLGVDDAHYWCAVEINGGSDVRQYFQLSVTTGKLGLWVPEQEVIGFIGETITLKCHHTIPGVIKWCKLGSTCVTGLTGSIDGTEITVNPTVSNVFSVTMSGLTSKSSGWYYCGKGDYQMPVHLNVTVRPTAAPTTTVTDGTVTESQGNATEEQEKTTKQGRSIPALMSLIIPLSLLILIGFFSLLILLILRTKHVKSQDSKASKLKEGEVTYSEVTLKKNKAAQALTAEKDAEVTYSSVVHIKQQSAKKTEAKNEDVTYSTIIHHQ